MNNFLPVYRRELKSYFYSPIAYLVIVVFLILSGLFFIMILNDYARYSFEVIRSNYRYNLPGLNVAEGIISPLYRTLSFLLILMMPLLTMKSFSEEKKSGTIELVFTYPISDMELVLGKIFALFTLYGTMLGFTLFYDLFLVMFKPVPLGVTFTGLLGLSLAGCAYISLGVFISSLTENQIVAAVWSFGMIMVFWIISWLAGDSTSALAEILRYLSIFDHFDSFANGVIDTSDIIFYLSFIFIFVFSTLRVLESRRYRG
ncbi:MAG: ABC transporter permease [Nitrospinota bacterium]|nr:ABC transporter permease [Nitrospinota bacterium]